jgi:hypothetical protein
MRRKQTLNASPASGDIEGALAVMDADQLRELIRDTLPELSERARGRVVHSLINRVARGGSAWTPAALSGEDVSEIVTFAEAAERVGHADPSDVDEYLHRGSGAFLRKDYTAASQIFGALLRPIGEGAIDLGQDETADEVLGVDLNECAAQYVVSTYMNSAPNKRAEGVRAAIDEVDGVSYFTEPLRAMERVAIEPLPQLDKFLPQWRVIIEKDLDGKRHDDWDSDNDKWLREVVRRVEGAEGLAKVARSTKRADDLRAWCESLVEARDWKAALAAFDEAAELITDNEYARGEFLDGAALATQEMGRKDLPSRLERAWRSSASMLRLRRWLGAAGSKAILKKRAAEALAACPKQAQRQRAFLHVLLGEFELAAKLLAEAPGLGWSGSDHPGHLLFPLLQTLLGGSGSSLSPSAGRLPERITDIEELALMTPERGEHRLATPEISQILGQAGVSGVVDVATREVVLDAMRKAAERRVEGVTGHQRRRHYGHAASLVAICASLDSSPATARWIVRVRNEYHRYSALRLELDRYLRSP